MSTDDRDPKNEAAPQDTALAVEDLTPKKVDAATADAVKGGRADGDLEANSEKIR